MPTGHSATASPQLLALGIVGTKGPALPVTSNLNIWARDSALVPANASLTQARFPKGSVRRSVENSIVGRS